MSEHAYWSGEFQRLEKKLAEGEGERVAGGKVLSEAQLRRALAYASQMMAEAEKKKKRVGMEASGGDGLHKFPGSGYCREQRRREEQRRRARTRRPSSARTRSSTT